MEGLRGMEQAITWKWGTSESGLNGEETESTFVRSTGMGSVPCRGTLSATSCTRPQYTRSMSHRAVTRHLGSAPLTDQVRQHSTTSPPRLVQRTLTPSSPRPSSYFPGSYPFAFRTSRHHLDTHNKIVHAITPRARRPATASLIRWGREDVRDGRVPGRRASFSG